MAEGFKFAAFALTGSFLLYTAYTHGDETLGELSFAGENTSVTAAQQQAVRADFEQIKDYWAATEPRLKDITLSVVTDDETGVCAWEEDSTTVKASAENALYCIPEKKVIITEGILGYAGEVAEGDPSDARDVSRIILAHEIGHAVQAGEERHTGGFLRADTKNIELQADCLAGKVSEDLFAIDEDTPGKFYGGFENIFTKIIPSDHGSAEERVESFQRGAAGEDC